MPNEFRYPRYRFPPAIISHAVWLYYRFTLSFREVEDLLAHRGVTVSYESIRHWCETFGLGFARRLRQRAGPVGDTWHLDELVTIRGQRSYPQGHSALSRASSRHSSGKGGYGRATLFRDTVMPLHSGDRAFGFSRAVASRRAGPRVPVIGRRSVRLGMPTRKSI